MDVWDGMVDRCGYRYYTVLRPIQAGDLGFRLEVKRQGIVQDSNVHNACLLFSPEGPSAGNQFKLMVLEVWGIGALTGSGWKGDMGRVVTGRAQLL